MEFQTAVENLINGAAKPPKSLGILEKHLHKMLMAWGVFHPEVKPFHVVYAADNGVVEEGVAGYPAEITYLQAKNMVDGRATISCFCNYNGIPYSVVDVGINHSEPVGINYKVAFGTKNFLKEPAMTVREFEQVWQVGREIVRRSTAQGANLLSFGEMGIGNTTTSSAVLHALTGILPEFVVGYGASSNNSEIIKRKRLVVGKGVEAHRQEIRSVEDILRFVGGFDIVAICASMIECTRTKMPFVIDGFITAVAYACAAKLNREVERYAIPSHLSKEPGMTYALLQGNIMVDDIPLRAEMALGEGTGAVLMVSLLKTMIYTAYNTARLSDFQFGAAENPALAAI